jgi:hypothetical protein
MRNGPSLYATPADGEEIALPPKTPEETQSGDASAAKRGAVSISEALRDSDFAHVAAAWPTLPATAREAILAIVRKATRD